MPVMTDSDAIGRRAFLAGVGVSTATLVALTAGQSFGPLAPFNAFAPRVRGQGPQGLPINRTARQAAVEEAAVDPAWMVSVTRADGTVTRWDREGLAALPQTHARLPIACVEGWSTTADWAGVRLLDLLDLAGISADRSVRIESLQQRGAFRATTMAPEFTRDPLTLVALELNGETLDLDHGYPARIIAPARPGVLQTKWLSSIGEIS
jgi:DMSO/TMAO reductase YedYZ molybdopterin-dependent catalytic subunit